MRFYLFFIFLVLVNISTFSIKEFGKVSYYSNKLEGRRMTNGERYNPKDFVAAHRRYPLGTILKVTNEQNGLFVIVRVTDRGPFSRSRVIDVSYAAALRIGLIATGYANAIVEEAEQLRFLLLPEDLLPLNLESKVETLENSYIDKIMPRLKYAK